MLNISFLIFCLLLICHNQRGWSFLARALVNVIEVERHTGGGKDSVMKQVLSHSAA